MLDRWFREMRDRIQVSYNNMPEDAVAIERFVDQPHPKKEMRRSALRTIRETGGYYGTCWMDKVDYKVKKAELAKPGKYPRGIGDLTAPGSIRGGFLIDAVKDAFVQGHDTGRLFFEFVKSPVMEKLEQVFNRLTSANENYFVYHSDDSTMSFAGAERSRQFDVDIKSCDGSHMDVIFELLKSMMMCEQYEESIEAIFQQCKKDCEVFNPFTRKEKIKLRPVGYVLYSGSVLTTVINDIANSLIALRVAYYLERGEHGLEGGDLVEQAAFDVGYLVTCVEAKEVEDIQFLKHSPVLNCNGELKPVLNLGVILRTFGQCDGDLPGRTRDGIAYRSLMFNTQLVQSYKHAGDSSLLEVLRELYPKTEIAKRFRTTKIQKRSESSGGYTSGKLSDDSLLRRYGISGPEWRQFLQAIKDSDVCSCIVGDVVHKVLDKDYSLPAYANPD